jgi:hypothetical protein
MESNLARTHKRSRMAPKAPPAARLIPDEIHASIGLSSTNPNPMLNAREKTINPEENMYGAYIFFRILSSTSTLLMFN